MSAKPEGVPALRYLTERGFNASDTAIHQIDFATLETCEERSGVYAAKYPKGTQCIILPHLDLYGEDTGYRSVRFVTPPNQGFGLPKMKVRAGMPPRAHFPVTNQFSTTLYITESWLKAVALSKHGKFSVGVNGCWGWSGGKNSEMIQDLWDFPWAKITDLVIVWDSNVVDNDNVKSAACALYHKLRFVREADVAVHILRVPKTADGKDQGVDDWIASGDFDLDTLSTFADMGIDIEESPFYTMNSKACYVGGSNVFVDLEDCTVMNERHFHTRYAPIKYDNADGKPVSVTRAWIGWQGRQEKRRIVVRPGADRLGDDWVNLWQPSDIVPTEGDVSIHEEFLRRAVPDPAERRYLQQWIGHAVQKQDVKMNVAMVFYSPEEGTGKTMTANAIGSMFGRHNVASITLAQLREGFNSVYATKQLVIMNENAKGHDSKALLEKLKTFITEEEVMVRAMHTNPYPAENHANVILTMNHADSLPMSQHDRRFNIVQFAPALVHDKVWAESVWDWHDSHAAELLWYYMSIDLEGFDPFRAPAMNEAKRELVHTAADKWTKAIIEMLSDRKSFFASLMWREDIRYVRWLMIAQALWHHDGDFTDKSRLQGDATRLGQAFKAQASYFGIDPARAVFKPTRVGGVMTGYVDLDYGQEEDLPRRERDVLRPQQRERNF